MWCDAGYEPLEGKAGYIRLVPWYLRCPKVPRFVYNPAVVEKETFDWSNIFIYETVLINAATPSADEEGLRDQTRKRVDGVWQRDWGRRW